MTADEFDRPEPVLSDDLPQPPREGAAQPAPGAGDATKLEAEIADLKDRLLRALAEAENIRRRGDREREETAKYAMTGFARDMLPVADNLGRALAAVPAESRGKDAAVDALIAGIELTDRELRSVFERHGIRRIDPMGERFDHNFHQAMMEVEDASKPSGTVVQVLQTGYVIKDRLLRPAMVAVSKGGKTEPVPPAAANQDIGHSVDTKA
ncbi:MAG: nucleotide exchange factor GrpE [Gemmatimonas sp.]